MRSAICCFLNAVAMLAVLAITPAVHAQDATYFTLPAQPLADALRAVGTQTNTSVVFDPLLVEGRQAPPLDAQMSLDQALSKLLAGTGLTHRFLNERTVVLATAGAKKANATSDISEAASSLRLAQSASESGSKAESTEIQNSTSSSANSEKSSAESPASKEEINEIVVTAQKRAESILDVPLSMSAYDQSLLEQRGISELGDILRSVPGVYMHDNDGFNSAVVVRGLTQSIFYQNTGAGPTVGTYFDETPITFAGSARVGSADVRFFDIERLEVLRGPQGTTFGDATLTGAVRIIPVAPQLNELSGTINSEFSQTGGYGSDNNKIEGVLNIPLAADKLALRASVYRHDNSGFYRTVSGSDPTSLALHTAAGSLDFAVDRDDQGANIATGGRIAALWQLTEDLSIEAAFFRQEVEQDGQGWAEVGTHENIHVSTHPAQQVRGHSGAVVDSQIEISSIKAKLDLGWGEVLTSLSRMDSAVQWNWASGPVFGLPWSYLGVGSSDSLTGEIRLTSNFEGPLQFQSGFYHEEIDATHRETTYHLGAPETNFFYADPFLGDSIYDDSKTQNAIFGELSYALTDRLKATGGARYYEYDRDNEVELKGGQFGFPSPAEGDGGNAFSLKSNDLNYKFDIGYRPGEDILIYGLWSQGFRLGRAQPGVSEAICDPDGNGLIFNSGVSVDKTRKLESDSLDNLEFGAKSTLFDRRMIISAAAFQDKWTGIPTLVHFGLDQGPVESAACIADINVGKAKATGLEFQASILVTKSLRIDVGGAYVDAKYEVDAPAIGVATGDRLPNAPKLNWNLSANYEMNVFAHSSYLRVDSHYAGSFVSNFVGLPGGGDFLTVDASVGTSIGDLDVSLFASNLTDEEGILYPYWGGAQAGVYTRPRTVGVRLKYGFARR